ncbi:uncharacterized protein BO88DRAFT_406360 [Aspergillus vadensis CBS 113365]|uniref:Uncharacterized protein n=1 Tax=Aspergillus vadensis (strain CBS 113365 / IMI 142717 / IBT 24658) TaxID=1448311 RepID=A0A319B435_ASPVC|nr:hypothetical protein BO88DRAFT_406360 [Aspergillus vadensis CBS 113365]PYH67125.1 hypothetical protein BO88DRAFT_406360 [Aspergillus vadensis CBS 113365]
MNILYCGTGGAYKSFWTAFLRNTSRQQPSSPKLRTVLIGCMAELEWGFDPTIHPACIYEAQELPNKNGDTGCQVGNQTTTPTMPTSLLPSQPQSISDTPSANRLQLTKRSVCSSCWKCEREKEKFWGFDSTVHSQSPHRTKSPNSSVAGAQSGQIRRVYVGGIRYTWCRECIHSMR